MSNYYYSRKKQKLNMDPFHKTVMTDISIVNPQVFDICSFFQMYVHL